MLDKIILFSIKNKLVIGICTLMLIAWGVYSLTQLPVDALPDITNNQVLVITSSPSLGAADIERLITFPVEQATINIPGITEQRSFSRFGLSIVTIVFNDHTDVYWARQQVSERLLQVQNEIPASLGTPFMGPVTTGLGEIFQYVVKPRPGYEGKYNAMELRTIQDWIIRPQIKAVRGVAGVDVVGGFVKQFHVQPDPRRLVAHHLTFTDVIDALEKNNRSTGAGYIEDHGEAYLVRATGRIELHFGNLKKPVQHILRDRNILDAAEGNMPNTFLEHAAAHDQFVIKHAITIGEILEYRINRECRHADQWQ